MEYNKILDGELTYLRLFMSKNTAIELTDNQNYLYLILYDFTDIEVYDEKFFDASKFGLQQNLNIYGIYELKSETHNRTLLIISMNDILIAKVANYEIIYKDKKEVSESNSCYIKCMEKSVKNYEISNISLGNCEKKDVEFEVFLNVPNQKYLYMSENYIEAYKITKHLNNTENNSFLDYLDKVFPVKDYIDDGYYHHMTLRDNKLSLEFLFSGVNFDVQLYEVKN